jgi:molybdate transport system substrate-binding protein
MTPRLALATWPALAALWLIGCERSDGPAALPKSLSVAAASDLQSCLPEVVERFRKANPGVEVTVTYGASGQLARQIRAGAPFDLFLSANTRFVKELADEKVVKPDSLKPYAVGTLALALAGGVGDRVKSLDDLAGEEIKQVAIANPETAPYGAAAKQTLEKAGLWEKLGPRIVRADTVRQALRFVETADAEAGFVGKSTALAAGVRVAEIDQALYDPIVQSLGVVAASRSADLAEEFARFLTEGEGQSILQAHGFRAPPGSTGP